MIQSRSAPLQRVCMLARYELSLFAIISDFIHLPCSQLWLTLSERHLQQRGVDWRQAEKLCFNEWSNPDDEELGIQIVKVSKQRDRSLWPHHNRAQVFNDSSARFSGPDFPISSAKVLTHSIEFLADSHRRFLRRAARASTTHFLWRHRLSLSLKQWGLFLGS